MSPETAGGERPRREPPLARPALLGFQAEGPVDTRLSEVHALLAGELMVTLLLNHVLIIDELMLN